MDLADAIRSGNYGDISGVPIARLVDAQVFLCSAIRAALENASAHMWPVSPVVETDGLWTSPASSTRGGIAP